MSKRGIEYELFVKKVYECLNRVDGLSDVQIQHDVKLLGAAGVEHQIDVFWTFKKGGVDYKVAVECKDYNTNVSKEKIESFHAILNDIGNIHGVFASKMGFQSGAKKYAQKYGIQLMEVRKPVDNDWNGRIKDVHFNICMKSIGDVKIQVFANKERVEELGIKLSEDNQNSDINKHEIIEFGQMIVDEKIIENAGIIAIDDLVKKLPICKPSKGNKLIYVFKDAVIHMENVDLPIDGIEFKYDTYESVEHLTIHGEDMIRAIVKNISDGSEKHIDKFGRVSSRASL